MWLKAGRVRAVESWVRFNRVCVRLIEGHKRSSIMAPKAPIVLNENYLRSKNSIRVAREPCSSLYIKETFDSLGSTVAAAWQAAATMSQFFMRYDQGRPDMRQSVFA